jgi:phosphatidate cytidylyltransferase
VPVTRLATAAVLIAGLLAALFLLPPSGLGTLVALIVALAAFEWGRLCRFPAGVAAAYALANAALLAVALVGGAALPAIVLGAAFWALVVPLWLWRGVQTRHAALLAVAGPLVLVPAALSMLALPPLEVLLALGLTWIADTSAYFGGRRFGRHKLAPAISPSKTWEGALAGLIGTLVYAIICASVVPVLGGISGGSWVPYLAAALLLGVASIGGDLFESAAKRQASVKDSGAMLPGHGGLLDRIDSATCTLPFAALLWPLIVPR